MPSCIDFFTFFSSLPHLLVYDRTNAIEVAFRMCSRRGATWDPEKSVLDEKDIRLFVEERYPTLDRKHALHRAVGILAHLDGDCSGGVSFEEFFHFCDMNPVFLTAVQRTLKSMRNAMFGEEFWKEFTKTARSFKKSTKSEIFSLSQVDLEDDNQTPGGFAASATRRIAAASRHKIGVLTAATANMKRQKMSNMSLLAHATGGKLRKAVSEASLGRRSKPAGAEPFAACNTDGSLVEKLKLWTSTPPVTIASKSRSLTARAVEAKATLRRVLSDPNLRRVAISERARLLKLPTPKPQEDPGERNILEGREGQDEDPESEEEGREGTGQTVEATANRREALTGARAKVEAQLFEGRQWAATETFYAHLATATERLEAKKSPVKGYDFSADFPKLWCAAHAHGSQGQKEIQHRRKRRSSASKTVANVYLRFITLWQEAGDDSCRSKLSKSFNRWRLNTCDATMDELSRSLSTLSRGSTAERERRQFDSSGHQFSHTPRRVMSLQEMWEAAAAAAGEEGGGGKYDLHEIIMNQARADRPLPWELCESYEREMIERIDRRQAENNVPLLPMPFC